MTNLTTAKSLDVKYNRKAFLKTTITVLMLSLLTACNQSKEEGLDSTDASNVSIVKPITKTLEPHNSVAETSFSSAESMAVSKQMPMPAPAIENTENYADIERNAVHSTHDEAFATLSIDTDTGSYANVRRFLNDGRLPPSDAVRVEELINYFNYDFSRAHKQTDAPFLVSTEVVQALWHPTNKILKVGIKAEDVNVGEQKPPSNLVFMVDVSGSMGGVNKLQLAKSSLKMLTKQLTAQDTITLITYAGNTEVVLPPTAGDETKRILRAIKKLNAGGSTNGEAAIKLAYQQAEESFKPKGINRILMLTDGDFNVGLSSTDDMLDIIRSNRDKGISLSTLGFGQGNYNDHMMEQVADNGNGNYSYIDSLSEAKKVLIDEMAATFNTVAKDVKIQVEFNPATVSEWRLIGYENRVLATEDFNNDKVDAGELGAGKAVVALFEITPVGEKGWLTDSRYQDKTPAKTTKSKLNDELAFLKIRYKTPNGNTSKLITYPIANQVTPATADTKFAMAVAGYGQLLTNSKYVADFSYNDVIQLAKSGQDSPVDSTGSRHEFVNLAGLAEALD